MRAVDRLGLPDEADLASSLGVSCSTVREDVTDYLETSIGLMSGARDVTLEQLVEARFALEVPAARLAAERRDEATLAVIRGAVEREGSLRDTPGRYAEQRTFHSALVAASGNEVLRVMAEPVFTVLVSYLRPTEVSAQTLSALQQEHAEIAGHVESQDGDAAAEAMHRHLERLCRLYQEQ